MRRNARYIPPGFPYPLAQRWTIVNWFFSQLLAEAPHLAQGWRRRTFENR